MCGEAGDLAGMGVLPRFEGGMTKTFIEMPGGGKSSRGEIKVIMQLRERFMLPEEAFW
jgi:hypothetical protein